MVICMLSNSFVKDKTEHKRVDYKMSEISETKLGVSRPRSEFFGIMVSLSILRARLCVVETETFPRVCKM